MEWNWKSIIGHLGNYGYAEIKYRITNGSEKATRDIRKYFEMNKNNTVYYNLWNAVKTVFRGIYKDVNAHISKEERYQIDNQNFYLKKL